MPKNEIFWANIGGNKAGLASGFGRSGGLRQSEKLGRFYLATATPDENLKFSKKFRPKLPLFCELGRKCVESETK